MLGGLELIATDGARVPISNKKALGLIAYLVFSPGMAASRDKIVGLLWGDRDIEHAQNSLRQTLTGLRRDLGPRGLDFLEIDRDRVALRPEAIAIDTGEFEHAAAARDAGDWERAALLYRGPFLDGFFIRAEEFERWSKGERDRLLELAIGVHERLAQGASVAARVEYARRLVALDPTRENSHGVLIAALAEAGKPDQAIRQYEACREMLAREFGAMPKARTEAIKANIAAVQTAPVAPEARVQPRDWPSPPEKPSIAVLPFVNMSGDPAQDYFGDGITENIIAALSRFRDLFVIARDSTFAYKGKPVKIQEVSRELGVHYVLEGSVQKSHDRIRINAQLIDGATGRHLWAEHFDRLIEDIFAIQDDVTEMIVGALATVYGGRLRKAWQGRVEKPGPRHFQAYDHFQRGIDLFNRFTREDVARARECFHQAVDLDSSFGKPYAKIAWTHLCDVSLGWSEDPADSMAKALEFATLAIARDDDEAWGHWALAGHHMLCARHDRAIAAYEKAMEINPNDADVLNDFGWCLSYAGRSRDGLEMVRKAMRLNPHYPEYWVLQLGQIQFDARQYEEAIATLESLRLLDTIAARLYLAASHAALDHDDQARKAVARAIELDPGATLQKCTNPRMAPYKDPKDAEHFRANLRQAGLPDQAARQYEAGHEKPAIAVLPFVNMSGEADQQYFSDGMTEEIITELSRFRSLFVIARHSSFQYRGAEIDVRRAGRELGVQFVVEGAVRKVGERVRVTAQLIDAASGNHLWAERYDRDLRDVLAVQDEIARAVAGTIGGRVEAASRERAARLEAHELRAYDLILRARAHGLKFTKADNALAKGLLLRAIEADPSNAQAHAY